MRALPGVNVTHVRVALTSPRVPIAAAITILTSPPSKGSALRPFLYVHKGVTQGLLELFRACYNLRTRRWGRHKGTSALSTLTGQPVDDWLSELGFTPSFAN